MCASAWVHMVCAWCSRAGAPARVRACACVCICAEFWQHWEGQDETSGGGARDGMGRDGSAAAEESVLLKGRSMEDLRPRQLYMY
jgi:hypothetical protein